MWQDAACDCLDDICRGIHHARENGKRHKEGRREGGSAPENERARERREGGREEYQIQEPWVLQQAHPTLVSAVVADRCVRACAYVFASLVAVVINAYAFVCVRERLCV